MIRMEPVGSKRDSHREEKGSKGYRRDRHDDGGEDSRDRWRPQRPAGGHASQGVSANGLSGG